MIICWLWDDRKVQLFLDRSVNSASVSSVFDYRRQPPANNFLIFIADYFGCQFAGKHVRPIRVSGGFICPPKYEAVHDQYEKSDCAHDYQSARKPYKIALVFDVLAILCFLAGFASMAFCFDQIVLSGDRIGGASLGFLFVLCAPARMPFLLLSMSATAHQASPIGGSENVGIVPVIVAELELGNMQMKVPFDDLVESADAWVNLSDI